LTTQSTAVHVARKTEAPEYPANCDGIPVAEFQSQRYVCG
jgi:hypothetical protein